MILSLWFLGLSKLPDRMKVENEDGPCNPGNPSNRHPENGYPSPMKTPPRSSKVNIPSHLEMLLLIRKRLF